MNNIWNDYEIVKIVKELKKKMRKRTVSSKGERILAPRFVFVCGKNADDLQQTIRGTAINLLHTYLVKGEYAKSANLVVCVISESLYVQDLAEDIFSFEKMLAEISQKIVIVTESEGAICELGAFVMDKECVKKTIVINENKEKYKKSFITNGPIKMLSNMNEKNVILYSGTIDGNIEFEDKMREIANENLKIPPNLKYNEISIKSLIYELANIIELFQPLTAYETERLYKKMKDFNSYTIKNNCDHKIRTISKVLQLMDKMNILQREGIYYRLNNKISCYNVMFSLTRKEFLDIRIRFINRLKKYKKERQVD